MLYTTGGNALLVRGTRILLPASLGISFYCIVISFTHDSLIPVAELSELLSSCYKRKRHVRLPSNYANIQCLLSFLLKKRAVYRRRMCGDGYCNNVKKSGVEGLSSMMTAIASLS